MHIELPKLGSLFPCWWCWCCCWWCWMMKWIHLIGFLLLSFFSSDYPVKNLLTRMTPRHLHTKEKQKKPSSGDENRNMNNTPNMIRESPFFFSCAAIIYCAFFTVTPFHDRNPSFSWWDPHTNNSTSFIDFTTHDEKEEERDWEKDPSDIHSSKKEGERKSGSVIHFARCRKKKRGKEDDDDDESRREKKLSFLGCWKTAAQVKNPILFMISSWPFGQHRAYQKFPPSSPRHDWKESKKLVKK